MAPADFNSYGSRRGNHEVMIRGTFANIRLRNLLLDGVEGGFTRDFTSTGEQASIYDAAVAYEAAGMPLVVLAGKEYGSGSSRDWAAKGTALLGVKAVIAESYERIHRSNLIGMGVLPLQFPAGQDADSLGLAGDEVFSISGVTALNDGDTPRTVLVRAERRTAGWSSSTPRCASTPPARRTTTATAGSCSTSCAASPASDPRSAGSRTLSVMTLVAGIDSSTQSTKVLVCDAETGAVVREGRAPHPDGTECPPEAWWAALGAGRGRRPPRGGRGRMAVGGQQHGMVALDASGEPVRPALLWNDARSAPDAADLIAELGGPQAWADAVGSVPVAAFTVTKLRWLARREPDLAARVESVLLPHDHLTWQLAGRPPQATTDRGDASGTGYWSPATGAYRPDLLVRALGHDAVAAAGRRPRRGRRRGGDPGAGRAARPGHRRQHGRGARPGPRPR